MAQDATQVQIGAAQIIIGGHSPAGAAGVNMVDVGFTATPPALNNGFEDVRLTAEQALGTIAQKAIGQNHTLKIPMLEVKPENWRIALRQPAANLVGGTLRVGDAVTQFHQIQIVITESLPASYTSLTITLWKCQAGQLEEVTFAKGAWVVLPSTFTVLKDTSVTTLDKYYKMVWA